MTTCTLDAWTVQLYRVVGLQGALRDVRRIEAVTGELDGMELRFVAAELPSASVDAAPSCSAAQRTRAAVALWRRAVADDDEDVDTLALRGRGDVAGGAESVVFVGGGSMMGCVVADGGFGTGGRDGWL